MAYKYENVRVFYKDDKYLESIITSLKEYKNFLRYSLFYATCFCRRDIEISFVKDCGDDKEQQPYFILNMLGIKEERDKASDLETNNIENNIAINKRIDNFTNPSRVELQKSSICMYRYMLDHLLDENMYFYNEFHIRYYTIIMLFTDVIKKLRAKGKSQINDMIIYSEVEKSIGDFRLYLPFWNDVDMKDIENKVKKDVRDYISEGDDTNEDEYLHKKLEFLMASIRDIEDESDENLIKSIHYSFIDDKKILKYLRDAEKAKKL